MPSISYIPGQILGRTDLNIYIHNSDGQRQDPYSISYAIYDNTTGSEMLIGSATRTPEHPDTGEYYASFRIPDFAPYGDYLIRWTFRQSAMSADIQVVQEFGVVPEGAQITEIQRFDSKEQALINSLRIMLRDNDPDRNYHFAPPMSQDALSKQTRVFGYIWTDDELSECLQRGLDTTNLYPPQSGWTIGTLPTNWRTMVLTGAAIFAIQALTLNWIHEEFDYSIGGVSLSIDKSSKYQGMMDALQSRFDKMLEDGHNTIKISKGLQQYRFGVGVRSAFGPALSAGVLSPRQFMRF